LRAPLMNEPTAELLQRSWSRMWRGLQGRGDGAAARDELVALYAQPQRKYHTLQHLRECLAHFESAMQLAQRSEEVEAGLWFHDAIYDLGAKDNEERSAQFAREVLLAAGGAPDAAERIAQLVLATKHTASPVEPDARLLVDIDLAILGGHPDRFAEYERQIRDEYAFVPEADFRPRRRAILQSFMARATIYSTPHFRDLLETRARANLARSLAL
jgi:predicted metal-dependent HD superfamily phosphohydrolase